MPTRTVAAGRGGAAVRRAAHRAQRMLPRSRDQAAATRIPRTLTDQEWEAALHSRVAKAADELLRNLPTSTGRRRPWLVATTRMPAEAVHTLRGACTAQGLRLASTVLPDTGNAVPPTARDRWEDAARRLADEARAQLPR